MEGGLRGRTKLKSQNRTRAFRYQYVVRHWTNVYVQLGLFLFAFLEPGAPMITTPDLVACADLMRGARLRLGKCHVQPLCVGRPPARVSTLKPTSHTAHHVHDIPAVSWSQMLAGMCKGRSTSCSRPTPLAETFFLRRQVTGKLMPRGIRTPHTR